MKEKICTTLNPEHFHQTLLGFLGVGQYPDSKPIYISNRDNILKEQQDKMDSITTRELSAPCGLDCFNCELYEENITEEMRQQFAAKFQKDPEEVACKGCRLEKGCKLLEKTCETLKCVGEKKVEFCFECDEFPCPKLQPAKDGADKFPHNFKLFNLCRMKAVGVEKWAEDEAKLIRQRYFKGKFFHGSGPILKQ
ncbi:DUF3795 domain-containing protein [candidate division KSB1 bacterium]